MGVHMHYARMLRMPRRCDYETVRKLPVRRYENYSADRNISVGRNVFETPPRDLNRFVRD